MLALAWLAYFGFGSVSVSLSTLITPIRAELDLSYGQVGVVLGAWQLVYIVASYPSGLLVDKLGTRWALAIGTSIVAASAFLRALAGSFPVLLASVGLFGIGGPIISIGLPKVIATWFQGRPRSVAAGIYTTGSATGSVLTLALTNSVVLPLLESWRAVFALYGLIVVVITGVWLWRAKEPPRAIAGRAAGVSFGEACRVVLRARAVWLVVIVGFTGFMTGHGFRSWLPQILESRGMTAAQAGYLAALPGLCGIAGSILVSRVAPIFGRQRTVFALLAIIGTALGSMSVASGIAVPLLLMVQGFCAGAILPLLMSILMDLREVGAAAMGAAAGIYFTVGEVGGFGGPAMMGLLKDTTGSFTAGLLLLCGISLAMLVPTSMLPKDGRR